MIMAGKFDVIITMLPDTHFCLCTRIIVAASSVFQAMPQRLSAIGLQQVVTH